VTIVNESAASESSVSLCPLLLGADDEHAGGGLDDVVGDGLKFVDREDSLDSRQEAFEEPGVAAGNPFDGGDGLGVGEVVEVQRVPEALPMPLDDEEELLAAQRTGVRNESVTTDR